MFVITVGVYVNTVTGHTLSFADAVAKGLIRCEGRVPEGMTSSTLNRNTEDVTDAVYTEQKSYTITGAKDTKTGTGRNHHIYRLI